MPETNLSGHCYCGAVKFEVRGSSDWIGHCHCESCRRASGSVMTTFAGFDEARVIFTGAMPNRFSSDDGVTRSFCGQCGSPIAYQSVDQPGKFTCNSDCSTTSIRWRRRITVSSMKK